MTIASSILTNEVISAYLKPRTLITRRIKIYESDGITPWTIDNLQDRLIKGDITVDAGRDERRSMTLTLKNTDGLLTQSESGFWYDKIIKTYRGIKYVNSLGAEQWYECQTGEFMIDTISDQRFPYSIDITGRDYTKKLLLDMFEKDTAFPAGSRVDEVVKIVATNAGITKYRLGAGNVVAGAAPTFARQTSRWEALKNLCEGLNVEIYFDAEGYLVTRIYDDVSTTAPYFSLSREAGKRNIVDYSKSSSDSNIFNHVVVTGTSEEETTTGYKYIAVLENKDPASPTSIQRIGRRTFPYEVSTLTSQTQANDLARRLLQVKQLVDYNLSFSAICFPWIEAGRILEFKDPRSPGTVPTRFLYSSFSIPMELGPMSGEAKRIVIAGSANTSPDEDEFGGEE